MTRTLSTPRSSPHRDQRGKTPDIIVLASRSAARKSLLQGAGLRFEACPAFVDERAIEAAALGRGVDLPAIAEILAMAKAEQVSIDRPGAMVIGADQVLACGDRLLHKPRDREEASRQLAVLRGRSHQLHAGLALFRDGARLWSFVGSATLTMRHFSDAEGSEVLALEGDAVLSSVGAYRLEGPSIRLFESLSGDYFTILGLPLLPLLAALREHCPETLEPAR